MNTEEEFEVEPAAKIVAEVSITYKLSLLIVAGMMPSSLDSMRIW
jgi:hypothetical protein